MHPNILSSIIYNCHDMDVAELVRIAVQGACIGIMDLLYIDLGIHYSNMLPYKWAK